MPEEFARLLQDRFGLPVEVALPAEGSRTLASILAHRTHRRYADRPVDDGLLRLLLACAFSAPAKSDLQQSGVVIVRDRERRQAIAELIPDMPWIALAPVFMVFVADSRRIRRICELRGKPFANDHLDAMLNAASDTAMVLATFLTAAEAVGLGCCPISVVRNHLERVTAILELPEHVFPLAGLCVGWPQQRGWVSMRLPPAVNVHVDRYDDARLEEEIDGYDRRRAARHAPPREQQRDAERFGYADFYGWSEDKARQVSRTERADLARFLRRRGFNLD